MSISAQIKDFLAGLFGRGAPAARLPVLAAMRSTEPREVVNDATAYGVAIEPVHVASGAWYWQAMRVHHLTPDENGGNHHIYADLLDSATADAAHPLGQRVFGGRLKVHWGDGEQLITVDKPLNEPGANFPMWKWQVCSVQGVGLPGEELPSDRVTGIKAAHPDEAPGNTLFHHSFGVTFCRVQATGPLPPTDSVIAGRVRRGAGRSVLLQRNDAEVANQTLGADEAFRFASLGAGDYVVAVSGADLRSAPLTVDGLNQASVELTLAAPDPGKPLAHYVLFGPADQPASEANLLLAGDYLLRFRPAFGFSATEAAGAALVTIIADMTAVSAETEATLTAGGATVQRISGDVTHVAAALAQRSAAGQPF